jgi:hypothetical protein
MGIDWLRARCASVIGLRKRGRMVERGTGDTLPAWRRAFEHPAVWSIPVMAFVVIMARFLNEGYYDKLVNYDPQGDDQLYEWRRTTLIFRYTSGVLFGQLLALVAGAALARRHVWAVALPIAVPLGIVLAAVSFTVASLLGPVGPDTYVSYAPFDDPVVVRVLVRELAAYPLYACAGVGLGVLLGGRRGWQVRTLLWIPVGLVWLVATITGLLQDDGGDAPHWLYWAVPPIAAATAIALTGLSMNVSLFPQVLQGDWGREASAALLVSAAAYAVALNLLAVLVEYRRRRRTDAPDRTEATSAPRAVPDGG